MDIMYPSVPSSDYPIPSAASFVYSILRTEHIATPGGSVGIEITIWMTCNACWEGGGGGGGGRRRDGAGGGGEQWYYVPSTKFALCIGTIYLDVAHTP